MIVLLSYFIAHLALHLAVAADECSNGDIRMTNGTVSVTNTTYDIAGALQVCVDKRWGTVCHGGWGPDDAAVACRQLGLSYTNSCKISCFGKIQTNPSFSRFSCTGTESRLVNCSYAMNKRCGEAAGVYCALNKTALRAECGTTPESVTTTTTASVTTTIATTTTESTSDQAATEKQAQEQWMVCNSTVVKALGAITGLLGVALVGVVMCLVLTCLKLPTISINNKTYGSQDIQLNTDLSSAVNPKPAQHSMQSEPSDIEGDYHLITSEDDTVEDEVYSVPYDENISRKENGIQKQVRRGPDQQRSGPVYNSVLETDEYKMYSTVY